MSLHSEDLSVVISYMPWLLSDELIYSLLGRVVAYNALGDPRDYLELLFENKNITPSVDLPTSLESLQRRLGLFSPYHSADEIINTGTLYPYHRPFLTLEHHEAARQIILEGGAMGLKLLLGRVANRFGANPPLRYFVICTEDDIARKDMARPGVTYWRRMHQLPGVTSCAIHGIELTVHVWPSMSSDRQRLLTVPYATIPNTPIRSSPMQIRFAQLSRELLEAGLPVLNLRQRQAAYETAVAALGFLKRNNRIDHEALAAAVHSHYEDFANFFHRDRLLCTPRRPLAWLRDIFDRPSRASHPICHLILIGFLFGTIEGFNHALRQVEHYDLMNAGLQTSISESSQGDVGAQHDLLLRDVSLSCRKVAQLLHLSVTTVVSRRRALGIPIAERRKHVTSAKLETIAKALAGGLSSASIARRYRVSISTVNRLRSQSTGLHSAQTGVRQDRERHKRRNIWMRAVELHKNSGVREIRSAAASTYAWLYRYDRAWLQEVCGSLHSDRKNVPWVDWPARDLELSNRLEAFVYELRLDSDRPRISRSLLLRNIGDAMVRANLVRLPKLNDALGKLVESLESFQIFRIYRATEALTAQGLPISMWRIQRLAGIRKWTKILRFHAARAMSIPR